MAVISNLAAGATYDIVVGAAGGNSTGGYNLTIDHVDVLSFEYRA